MTASVLSLSNCRSIVVNKKTQHSVSNVNAPIALGSIGIHKRGLISDYFNTTGIPVFKDIRVHTTKQNFTKRTFEKYLKNVPENQYKINYADSLEPKPQFVNFKIIDNINLLKQINNNDVLINYLKTQNKANIVNELSVAISKSELNDINSADAFFLKSTKKSEYIIDLYKDDKSFKSLKFNNEAILGYSVAYFCWETNQKNEHKIVELTPKCSRCPKNTSKSLAKEKEQNIKKFTRL